MYYNNEYYDLNIMQTIKHIDKLYNEDCWIYIGHNNKNENYAIYLSVL